MYGHFDGRPHQPRGMDGVRMNGDGALDATVSYDCMEESIRLISVYVETSTSSGLVLSYGARRSTRSEPC